MIRKLILFSVLVEISINCSANESPFGQAGQKAKEDYTHSKCIKNTTNYTEYLTYEEICKYGTSCPEKNQKNKFRMYCMESNLSECFEKKSWKTSNQLVGLPSDIKIGLLTQGMSFKKGAKSGQTCAYYN